MRATMLSALLLALALPAAAQEPVGGVIVGEEGRIEVLPEPPPVGEVLRLKEGWIRVEWAPEGEVPATGSFGVIRARPAPPAAPGRQEEPEREPAAPAAIALAVPVPMPVPAADACREERNEYLRALLEMAEIHDVEDPIALLSQLEQLPGLSPYVRLSIFGLPTAGPWAGPAWIDPIRPLGWDEDVRWAARELERCASR